MQSRGSVNAAPVRNPVEAVSSHPDLNASIGRSMAAIGGFEESPHLAIGLSGGSDSVALLHLACEWAHLHDAKITALTVDHGLRTNSREEAEIVGNWSRNYGADHHILTWQNTNRTTGIQSAARQARYQLMDDWCRDNAVLHLLVGHTLDDQIETHLMRQHHGSGPEGLAGMSQIVEMSACRLLRPMLLVTRQKLREYLRESQTDWVDDPSNEDDKFERVRWRSHILTNNLSISKLGETVKDHGHDRVSLNQTLVVQAARCVNLHPFGFATVLLDRLEDMPKTMGVQLLARVLAMVGGRSYVPSMKKTEPLFDQLVAIADASITAAGCRIIRKGDSLSLFREYRNLPASRQIRSEDQIYWDQRFRLKLGCGLTEAIGSSVLRPFEDADWTCVFAQMNNGKCLEYPLEICMGLPVIADDEGLFAVPHLRYLRTDNKDRWKQLDEIVRFLSFSPLKSLSGSGFSVA